MITFRLRGFIRLLARPPPKSRGMGQKEGRTIQATPSFAPPSPIGSGLPSGRFPSVVPARDSWLSLCRPEIQEDGRSWTPHLTSYR